MDISIRPCLTAGVAVVTAAALALVPSIEKPSPAVAPPAVTHVALPPMQLIASVRPEATAGSLPNLLVGWLERVVVPPSAGQPLPTPQFPPSVSGTSIDSTIKNVYNAIEPWVRYGFELATYAVGWIPYVGWLSPQIMIFYNFGERIVRSITFNVADWLGGNVSFVQGLVNVGRDTVNSLIQLGVDELNFFLPPLPPLPPFPFAATHTTTQADETHGVKGDVVAAVDTAKEPKKPTKLARPTTSTSESSDGTAQGDVKVSKGDERGANGPTAAGATNSTDSSGTNGTTHPKHDKKGAPTRRRSR